MDSLRRSFFFALDGMPGLDRSHYANAQDKNDRPNIDRPDHLTNPRGPDDLTDAHTDRLIDDLAKDLPPKTRRLIFAIIILIGALIDGGYSFRKWYRSHHRQP